MAELWGFTAEHVQRLTGLSARQLSYWDQTGFFSPTLLDDYRRRAFSRIYSFRDVVGLRVIATLRKRHKVTLQQLRRVGEWLHTRHEAPWASLRFGVAGRRVVFLDPDSGNLTDARGTGQIVFPIAVEMIANEMREAAARLRERAPEQIGKLERNRYVVHNKWVVAGTRIPTLAIWNYYAAGYSTEQIIREFPRLTEEDVFSAIDFELARQLAA